jgi:glutamate synthase domain-containing protein 3
VPVGNFTGTGMHGGRIFIRTNSELASLPAQVIVDTAADEDVQEFKPYLAEFVGFFNMNAEDLAKEKFYVLKPNAKNPYKQLYTTN